MTTETVAPPAGRQGRRAALISLLVLICLAAGVTVALDEVLLAGVHAGTDNALRLAAILTYVGVDGSYTLARALGITALLFSYGAVLLALLAAGSRRAGRPSWPVIARLHRQMGLVVLALVAGHAALPFASVYTPYGGWATNFVPFAQPSFWGTGATDWESLGILAFYLGLLTGPTLYLAGRFRRGWTLIHRLTIVVYVLSVLHAFFLGTDFLVRGPARVALLVAQVPLLVLFTRRLRRAAPEGASRWAVTGAGLAGSAGVVILAVLVATDRFSGGMRL